MTLERNLNTQFRKDCPPPSTFHGAGPGGWDKVTIGAKYWQSRAHMDQGKVYSIFLDPLPSVSLSVKIEIFLRSVSMALASVTLQGRGENSLDSAVNKTPTTNIC